MKKTSDVLPSLYKGNTRRQKRKKKKNAEEKKKMKGNLLTETWSHSKIAGSCAGGRFIGFLPKPHILIRRFDLIFRLKATNRIAPIMADF